MSPSEIAFPGHKGEVPATLVTGQATGGRAPAIVFVHWGQGNRHEFLGEARYLAGLGVSSLLLDAPWNRPGRRSPEPREPAAPIPETVEDVERGIEMLIARPDVDPERVAFVGHGFGAQVGALLAGRERRLAALVLMGGSAAVEGSKSPIFLQFARNDEAIPLEQAERLLAAAPEPKLWRFYDGDHGFDERARDDRIAWLLLHLGLPPAPRPDPPRIAAPEVPFPGGPEVFNLRIVTERPGMDAVAVRRQLVYQGDLALDVYTPPNVAEPPVVVLVHGQGHPAIMGRIKDAFCSQARFFASRGSAVVVPNLGSSVRGAERERWLEGVGDVAANLDAALAWIEAHAGELGVEAGRLGLVVYSAGGSYGMTAALTHRGVRCAVGWNTFLSGDHVGPKGAEYDPSARLRADSPPVLVVRSQRDLPPINASVETFLERAKRVGARVEVIDIRDGHHAADLFDDTEDTRAALRRAVAFLAEHL